MRTKVEPIPILESSSLLSSTDKFCLPAMSDAIPISYPPGDVSDPGAMSATMPKVSPPLGPYESLRILAEVYNDAQQYRIGLENRLRAAPGALQLEPLLAVAVDLEHEADKSLIGQYRVTASAGVLAWQKAQKGIGEHLLARLLGHLGDPRVATPHHWVTGGPNGERTLITDEPYNRGVSQLWSYGGYGDSTRKPVKGMTQDEAFMLGSPTLKMLVWNLACCCIKTTGYYRQVYVERRVITPERLHATDCKRCGPSGKPAKMGTPWSKGHQHADALRIVGKEILRDLWVAAEVKS